MHSSNVKPRHTCTLLELQATQKDVLLDSSDVALKLLVRLIVLVFIALVDVLVSWLS